MNHAWWLGHIERLVDEWKPEVPQAKVEMVLESVMYESNVPDRNTLPRAGESYWLVDDETFRRLVLEETP